MDILSKGIVEEISILKRWIRNWYVKWFGEEIRVRRWVVGLFFLKKLVIKLLVWMEKKKKKK